MKLKKSTTFLQIVHQATVSTFIAVIALQAFIGDSQAAETTKFNSLYQVLDLYDCDSQAKKQALEYLLKKSGSIEEATSLQEEFPPRHNNDDLFRDILKFVKAAQEKFVIRQGHQERWQVTTPSWMQEDTGKLKQALTELGLTREIYPSQTNPNAICILGATHSSMTSRMNYASKLIKQGTLTSRYLILLAGERKVTVGVDGSEEDLSKIALRQGKNSVNLLTETDLIKDIYENSDLVNKFEVVIIDTPAGNLPRPTTETTLLELSKWLADHKDIKKIVFVSHQPYVGYQNGIISAVLQHEELDIKFNVVGPAAAIDIAPSKLLEALGSEIWARTPTIIASLNINLKNNPDAAELAKLYEKTPLVYSVLSTH